MDTAGRVSEEARAGAPGVLGRTGAGVLEVFQILGEAAVLFVRTLAACRHLVRDWRRVVGEIARAGNDTLPIALLVSLFVGMVLVIQAADQLSGYTQEVLGSIVGLAMTKELGPVVMGFLIAGRVGSAMAAEIASMTVFDEVNALRTMDIDPVRFLSLPRVVAATIALPVVILYADLIGILGGALVVAIDPSVQITTHQYFDNLLDWVAVDDVVVGLVKGAAFGLVTSVICCTFGFRARGGAAGVATATTAGVVWSFVLIIVFDYVIVRASFLF